LNSRSIQFKSFWMSNQIYIKNANLELVKTLASIQQVEEINQEAIILLDTPVRGKNPSTKGPVPLAEWGIERVKAQEAWATTNGSGVVVANIDTGVHFTHEALASNYRADHGWYDPYDLTSQPNDDDGHGTHTMGTIAGSHGVGVAPGAQWIACKGCGTFSCSQAALSECAEWVLCPTNADGSDADCSKAPVVSSNSWGGGQGNTWYEPFTEAWIAGGIIPVFANGNSGPSCGTANSPADLRRVIGVGSTNVRNEISSYSSLGPSSSGRLKPELSAPGENVRSSVPGASNNAYDTYSGTSMACPHAAGVTALVISAHPDMTFAQVRRALLEGCDQETTSQSKNCGSINDSTFPNHVFGMGIINAVQVLEAANKIMAK